MAKATAARTQSARVSEHCVAVWRELGVATGTEDSAARGKEGLQKRSGVFGEDAGRDFDLMI